MFYTIYKTTNRINGKFYVGKHQTKNLDDGYLGSGKLLKRAIAKYGIENFSKQILYVFDNEAQMNAKEKELVVISEQSYNLCPGGKGGFGYINNNITAEQKKISNARRIFRNLLKDPTYYAAWKKKTIAANQSTLVREKRRKALLKSYENRPGTFAGKKHTIKTKLKMSASKKEKTKGAKNSQFGTFWITNGFINKKCRQKQNIPLGFYKGRKCMLV